MNDNASNTFKKNSKYLYRFACEAFFSLVAAVIFFCFWYEFVKEHNNTGSLLGLGNLGMATGIYLILFVIIGRWLHAFKVGVERVANILASQVLTIFTVNIIECFVSCAITGQFRFFFSFMEIYFLAFIVQSVINCIFAVIMINAYRRTFPPLNIIEVYGDYRNDLCYKINGIRYKYVIKEQISVDEDEDTICDHIKSYDAVLLNDLPAHKKNKLVKMCYKMDKRVYFMPKISDILVKNSEELNLIDTPLFLNRNSGITTQQLFMKRFFDIVLSFSALVILSPLFLITALAIHLEDGGPVFFRQERVTIGGRRFMILKFRSMIVDAEKDGRPRPAGEKDDRITKVGSIIRAIRVDELPQLINILAGDMSIVGPRPERWEHVEKYTQEVPEFPFRHKMKGGLTGYAQVYGKYNTNALDKLKLDLLYITNYSLLLDLQIIFETIKILVQKESTEGFTDEARKDMHDADV
ncbi:exopolysaccharide biosynthesis polyprenyl glycosylphosphotransferase [Butyrivibrio fibrisolvens DSM 3071]|uniref:Exopolysaccharide biosynthesis polyprenyl glycosylphosphotransferase n=1 Tax=Butyrivibrio fibrisolvens DSM 3071 TaxID=1121131 RepID=A0A1M6AA00_BUTFI|nr:exopolysaccharide biosynthesis polyprenyl glycosylphosphotransferase [Butyrivibrio fibrisolvens]SHI33292.1 exopolysaccharide biosynthesis polyprenyl glycosylphosphotransferase [Butyrivibrio fibrisolvens DSM 3071]